MRQHASKRRGNGLTGPVLAGIAAGVLATPVQMLCWWIGGAAPFGMLLRDTRLAAAILLGPQVLPPPLDLAPAVLLAAGAIHLLLSAVYGLALAPVRRLPVPVALLVGAGFGALLFGINMFGFTGVFPWFAASRDGATFAAHLAFGLSAAWLCTRWR